MEKTALKATPAPVAQALSPAQVPDSARWALGVLLAVNLVNYLDRYVLSAVLPLIKADLQATDTQLGLLASAFMLVYMCAAVPIGYLADRFAPTYSRTGKDPIQPFHIARKAWIVFGIVFWSLATIASGLTATFRQLFLARAAVGIGESSYGSISPSFVAEYFPKEKRAGALALFSMAIPVGSALGFVLGGAVGQYWGWRQAFFMAGLPGLFLAWLASRLRDPRDPGWRSPADAAGMETLHAPTLREYSSLARNRSLILCSLSMAAMTFGLGAFAIWTPTFYVRSWSMELARANTLFGAITVLAGLAGSLSGGWLADRCYRLTSKSYFLVSGIGLLLAFPMSFAAVLSRQLPVALAALFLTEFFAFLNMGPLNAVIVNVTPAAMRSMAFAANIFVIHALGDAVSPTIVGRLSDLFGLQTALLCAAVSLAVSGLLSLWGTLTYDEDARSAAGRAPAGEPCHG